MRLVWVIDAGLATAAVQRPGVRLARDGCSATRTCSTRSPGMVGEYDGADHKELDRRRADNAREAAVPRRTDWSTSTVVEGDLRDRSRRRRAGCRRRERGPGSSPRTSASGR